MASKSEQDTDSEVTSGNDYLFPSSEPSLYNGRLYSVHALERMALPTPPIVKLLLARTYKRMKSLWISKYQPKKLDFSELDDSSDNKIVGWWIKLYPEARAIMPSEVERELESPGSTGLFVVTDSHQQILTAYRENSEFTPLSEKVNEINKEMRRRVDALASKIEHDFPTKSHNGLFTSTGRKFGKYAVQSIKQTELTLHADFRSWEKDVKKNKLTKKHVDVKAWKAAQKEKAAQNPQREHGCEHKNAHSKKQKHGKDNDEKSFVQPKKKSDSCDSHDDLFDNSLHNYSDNEEDYELGRERDSDQDPEQEKLNIEACGGKTITVPASWKVLFDDSHVTLSDSMNKI